MSNKKRKIRKKPLKTIKPKRVISSQQNIRLQQATHAQSAGNLTFAETEYRSLIAEKIKTPQIYCQLAAICAQTARRREADSLWKQALAISPRYLEAQMNLAESLQQAGKNRASHNFEIRYSRFSGLLPFTINDSVA